MALDRRWWLIAFAALVAVAVTSLVALSQPVGAEKAAVAAQPSAGRFTMVSGTLGDKSTAVFVIDAETMRLLVYAVDSSAKQLKLVAARDISQDVLLSHWNSARPWPEDIRQRVNAGEAGGKDEPDAKPE